MKGESYEEFVEKFKPKRTTDDCYTPEGIYEIVKDWAVHEYNIEGPIIRPFWPGANYQDIEYHSEAVVIDNPPFSILQEIVKYFTVNEIPFFLFAPSLRLSAISVPGVCYIGCGEDIIFENGAVIGISFVTNMEEPDVIVRTAPDLTRMIREEVKRMRPSRNISKYIFPDNILTAAMLEKYAQRGLDYQVRRSDALKISKLDAMGQKSIYGGALLLSERAAAERAAAERAAAIRWELSERELDIIYHLGDGNHAEDIHCRKIR